ncbi:MAG: fibronectin type III domain-containing protein [Lachnospiraceae bacterium]|nr:fibronectin type III domain-containing protein [Lachnospiraceae bacterium]
MSDIVLPEGWVWKDSTTSLTETGEKAFPAVFTPEDTTNYNTAEESLTVKVFLCDHKDIDEKISVAREYYDRIKNDSAYATIATDLKKAIEDAKKTTDDYDVSADELSTALAALSTAINTAQSGVKDADDAKAANSVSDKIEALKTPDQITLADRSSIEAARSAYNALTDDQKAKVSADTLKKLTDAENRIQALDVEASSTPTPEVSTNGKNEVSKPQKPIIQVKNSAKGTVALKVKNVEADGYEIIYALNKKLTKKKKTKTITVSSGKIKKLKKGKTYYFKVRAFNKKSDGTKMYGDWSSVKKVKIKKYRFKQTYQKTQPPKRKRRGCCFLVAIILHLGIQA